MQRIGLLALCVLLFGIGATAQVIRKVLFLGNSYTGYNNLPQLVHDVAQSAGDTLIFDNYNPGDYTLEDHSLDPNAENKIMAGDWQYLVLQGQSREPILNYSKFRLGAGQLTSQLRQYHSCAVPMLYMTWGRKNGDATNCPAYPEMCTYESMDSTLRDKYLTVADRIDGVVSPVSVVWRNLRENHPNIELYHSDGSHPSPAGSYAAACSFYASIFQKDPTAITFNYNLSAADAAAIRNAAKTEVYDSLQLWDYQQPPHAEFHYRIGAGTNEVIFSPISLGITQDYLWDFGDGSTSTTTYPIHSYASNGTYTVTLTTIKCDLQGTHTSTTDTVIQFCDHTPEITTTKAWLCYQDTLWTQVADAYQWYSGSTLIPETMQFLPNYQQYNSFDFSVRTTVNGCSELSQAYQASPEWSGYFFDAAWGGDPCDGDTVVFAVLHNFALNGSEVIRWYRNDSLLPAFNDQDTLLITTGGSYLCKVVNPNSNCPLDTTYSGNIDYDCGSDSSNVVGLVEPDQNTDFSIYPNPAADAFTIVLADESAQETVHIYGATGNLVRTEQISGTTQFHISNLLNGLYYLQLDNSPRSVLKFVKY